MSATSADRQALVDLLLRRELETERERGAIRPRPDPVAPAPLSFGQMRIWIHEQLWPGTGAYNEVLGARIRGPLDPERLERSLDQVVGRHESLRSSIALVGEEPAQVVLGQVPVGLDLVDLTTVAPTRREEEAMERVRASAAHPFDLAHPPLLRLTIYRLAEQDHVLALTIHHIISDGWSIRLLMQELIAAYGAGQDGRAASLPTLPVQFADFAVWQRAQAEDGIIARQLDYWREHLAGAPQVLDLPFDRARRSLRSFAGGTHTFTVEPALVRRLEQLARDEGASLFMTLLAAFDVLLARYTGQDDLLVGTPAANRPRLETEHIIGCFINTLVMRADLAGAPTFRRLLGRVRSTVLDAFTHQDVPLERLVEELQPRRELGRNPIFQVQFVLHNQPLPIAPPPELSITPITGLAQAAKLDLTLAFTESADGLEGCFEFDRDLFDPATIRRMASHLTTLLEAIVENPDGAVPELTLLTEPERRRILGAWLPSNEVHPAPDRRLHELFEAQVARTPDAVAVACGEDRLTYAELNGRADQLARRLRARGVDRGALVALCLERSIETAVGVLGVLKTGGAYVPIDPADPADRIRFVLDDTNAAALVTQRQLRHDMTGWSVPVMVIDALADDPSEEPGPFDTTGDPADLAYVIYTSGSTGSPKGVMIEHRNVVRLFSTTAHWFEFGEGDVWPLFHSYAFDVSVWEMWGAWLHGGRLVIVPYAVSRSPERLYDLLVAEQATVLCQTPTAFSELVEVDPQGRGRLALRFVVLAGERLDFERVGQWFERHPAGGPQIVNMYGTTETTVHATYREVGPEDAGSPQSLVGVPIPDLRLLVVDRHFQPVPDGVPGELLVAGAGVGRGYLHRPELTEARFIVDPLGSGERCYRTGDVVRRTPDGDLEYLRRLDAQVKVRGFRVELGEVEAVLRRHPGIREAVVTADGNARLVAHLVAAGERPPSVPDLNAFLRSSLPEHMRPAAYVYVDGLPRTTNGKVDRNALPPPTREGSDLGVAFRAPGNVLEHTVADAWCQMLDVDRVGVDDNFFDLGGHSVLAIQLHRRLTGDGLSFEVIDVFQYPTVRSFADRLARGPDPVETLDRSKERGARRRAAIGRRRRPSRLGGDG